MERLANAAMVATSTAVTPALAYRRKRIAPPVKAAKPSVWPKELAMKRREEDPPVAQALAQVAQRQHVIAAEHPVADAGEAERREHVAARYRLQMREDPVEVQPRELTVQHVGDRAEHQQRGERPEPGQQPPGSRSRWLSAGRLARLSRRQRVRGL